jgi:hypothetical protein
MIDGTSAELEGNMGRRAGAGSSEIEKLVLPLPKGHIDLRELDRQIRSPMSRTFLRRTCA